MTDVTSADDDDVLTEIVCGLEGVKVINRDVCKVVSIALDWLTKLMVTISVEVGVFKCHVLEVFVVGCMISGNFLFKDLEFSSVHSSIGDAVTEEVDSAGNIVLENCHS